MCHVSLTVYASVLPFTSLSSPFSTLFTLFAIIPTTPFPFPSSLLSSIISSSAINDKLSTSHLHYAGAILSLLPKPWHSLPSQTVANLRQSQEISCILFSCSYSQVSSMPCCLLLSCFSVSIHFADGNQHRLLRVWARLQLPIVISPINASPQAWP